MGVPTGLSTPTPSPRVANGCSQANQDLSCVRNMNCFACCAAMTLDKQDFHPSSGISDYTWDFIACSSSSFPISLYPFFPHLQSERNTYRACKQSKREQVIHLQTSFISYGQIIYIASTTFCLPPCHVRLSAGCMWLHVVLFITGPIQWKTPKSYIAVLMSIAPANCGCSLPKLCVLTFPRRAGLFLCCPQKANTTTKISRSGKCKDKYEKY